MVIVMVEVILKVVEVVKLILLRFIGWFLFGGGVSSDMMMLISM